MSGETTPLRFRAAAAKAASTYRSFDDHPSEEIEQEGSGDEHGEREKSKKNSFPKIHVLDGVAAAAASSSIVAMGSTEGSIVKAASALSLAFGPYAAYQKRRLKQLSSLRQLQNRLRQEMNYFVSENIRLSQTLERLDRAVARLEEVEDELLGICKDVSNLRRLVEVAEAQREVSKEMKRSLKAVVMQNVLSVVTRSDKNRDFQLSPTELESLIIRMGLIEGVKFNESEFRKRMASNPNGSLKTVLGIFRTLLSDDKPDGNEIFVICPDMLR